MAALPTQIVPLPLVGGLDESVDPTAGLAGPGALIALQNLVYDQAGAVTRRDGSEALPLEATDGVALETVDHLLSHGGELLAIGDRPQTSLPDDPLDLGPYLWSYSEALSQWAPRSQVPPASWTAEALVTPSEPIPVQAPCYICHAGGLEVTIWGLENGSSLSLMCRAVDVETGAVVLRDSQVDVIDGRYVAFAMGDSIVVVVNDGGPASAFAQYLMPTSTLLWSGPATAHTADAGGIDYWDACPISSTRYGICYSQSTDNQLYVARVTPGTGSTRAACGVEAQLCSVRADSTGTMIATVAVDVTNSRISAWTHTVSTMGPAVSAVEIIAGADVDYVDRLSCCIDANGRVWAVADTRKTIVGPTQMQRLIAAAIDDAGFPYSASRYAYWTGQAARPFVVGQRVYLLVGPSTYGKTSAFLWGLALVDLASHPSEPTGNRPLALVGLLPSLRYQLWWSGSWRHVPFVSGWVFPMEVARGQGQGAGDRYFDRGVLTFGAQSGLWRSAPANGGLCITGAVTSWYDGHAVGELGFAHRPAIYSVAKTEPAAFAGANTTYNYAVTWAWADGAGLLHESEPSAVETVTFVNDQIGIAGASAQLLVHTLQVTRKGDTLDYRARRPLLRLYRTLNDDPSVYYLCAELDIDSIPDQVTASITDSDSDEDLVGAARGILYTVGGRLEHQAPPPSSAVVQAKRRLWLASSVAPEVWFSGELLPGEGPWFHALQTLRLEGEEPITALASLDDRVVIFTARSIYVVAGEGPNDKGEGGFVGPSLVSSSAGCINARSVVSWRGGVFFESSEGLALLDRSLQVTYVGAQVQTQLASYPTLTASSLDAAAERIYWAHENPARGQVLWYDYGVGQSGAWGTFRYDDEEGDALAQRSLVVHGGRLVRSHDGLPHRSLAGERLDAGVWITAAIRTSYLALASLAGAQRVRRFVVSGYALNKCDWTFRSYFDESETATEETTLPASVHGSRESRLVVHLGQQRGSSVSLELEEEIPDPIPSAIGALKIVGLGVEVGVMPGVARVVPSRRR